MGAFSSQEKSWPARRWFLWVAGLFGLQIICLALISGRPSVPKKTGMALGARVISDAEETRVWQSETALKSPTVFSQVDPKSFSGTAWLNQWRGQYRSQDWSEPPRWLAHRRASALDQEALTEPGPAPLGLGTAPVLRNAPAVGYGDALSIQSRLEVEGDMKMFSRFQDPPLPSWPRAEVLTNSTVEVMINRAGDTVSARLLLPGSGLKAADDFALQWARRARYRSAGDDRDAGLAALTGGKLIFHWCIEPPGATNTP
jgi:hypothetical protein